MNPALVAAGPELAKNTKLDLNDLAKKYLLGVGCVLGGVVLYLVIKKIKKNNIQNSLSNSVQSTYTVTSSEKNEAKTNGFTESTATTYANRLYNAMKGVGTDEDTVVSTIESLKSAGELKMVCSAFGTQKYTTWSLQTVYGDLVTWLKDELSGSTLKRVKAVFNKFNVAF